MSGTGDPPFSGADLNIPFGPLEYPEDEFATAVAELPQRITFDRSRPVAVTGAAGLVGTHLCSELVANGYTVRALVRNVKRAAQRIGHLRIEIRTCDIRDERALRADLAGAGAIVHLAAIAIERSGELYADVNTGATRTLIDVSRSLGIDRFVYMSQNGADSRSPFAFLRSKGVAEDLVTTSDLRWTVLRPSVIFGPEDEFVNVLARLVRLSPLVYPLPARGRSRFQPVAVADVARATRAALESPDAVGQSYSIAGSTPLTLRQMVERILIAMNTSRILVPLPAAALRPLILIAERLLPRPPVTSGLLDLLAFDNVVEHNDLVETFGISPTPFAPEELLYLQTITTSSALRSFTRRD